MPRLRLLRLSLTSAALAAGCLASLPLLAQTTANISVDTTQTIRTVDPRVFGINSAVWDSNLNTAATTSLLTAAGTQAIRFPGGSTADQYTWNAADTDAFAAVIKNTGAQAFITANYYTGTPASAAAWVTYANVTKGYGFKYWEIGNEIYGSWEPPSGVQADDPVKYATKFAQFYQAMKAADPTIKIGACTPTSTEGAYNFAPEAVTDPVTGKFVYDWTSIFIATLKSLGVTPDFLICHRYEQQSGQENDATLLQLTDSASVGWQADASVLRTPLNDFLGSAAAGVELCVTENNSVHNNPGKQTTSLVNGLYMADAFGNLLQTEFNALLWWDLRNGPPSGGTANESSSLYGWRVFGDYGVVATAGVSGVAGYPTLNTPYPTYYVAKLLSAFTAGGDTVVKASSDSKFLTAFAVKRQDGSVGLLVINKDPVNTWTGNIALTGYSPSPAASVISYGIPQDTAAQTGTGSPDLAASSISNAAGQFSTTFGPYSATVISLSPPFTVTTPPASATLDGSGNATLSVAVSGTGPFTYQWYQDGVAITSATNATYTATAPGFYKVQISNAAGSEVTASVPVYASDSRLVNISTRAQVGTGANVMIAGFVVAGQGNETVLVRAVGPGLIQYNVSGTLAQPSLSLVDGAGNPVASNTGWSSGSSGNTTLLATTATQVGAFALTAGSADSALVTTLAPGAYTAETSGVGSTTGVALAEVYESGQSGAHLVNVSTRAQVGTGANIMIAGFVVAGSQPETVLIRAVGPGLTPYNVPGVLAQPVLTVIRSNSDGTQTQVAANAGWGTNANAADISQIAKSVGAFALAVGSADSALVLTLQPGAYTAEMSGTGTTTGVGLIEVYEVP